MNAPSQLSMFEPTGDTLATLARNHARHAEQLNRVADSYGVSGFIATGAQHRKLAQVSEEQAAICEMALQFEQLAGLA